VREEERERERESEREKESRVVSVLKPQDTLESKKEQRIFWRRFREEQEKNIQRRE